MKMTLAALEAAVALQLSPFIAGRLRPFAKAVVGSDADEASLTSVEAGRVLAAVFYGLDVQESVAGAEALTLSLTELSSGGAVVLLGAGETAAHPLLRDWVGLSLPVMLSRIIECGVLMSNLASGAPFFHTIDLVGSEGVPVHATVGLSFPDARAECFALAVFGQRPVQSAPLARIKRISGDALFAVGQATQPSALGLSSAVGAVVAAQEAVGATFH